MNQMDKWQKEINQLSQFSENATNKKLFKYYREALIDIKKEMKVFMDDYENLSFSKKLEAERRMEVVKQIDGILRDTYDKANGSISDHVKGEVERGYYGTWYAMEGAKNIELDMSMLPEKYIKQLVHRPVKGQVFSKRLYKHRNKLAKQVNAALLDAAVRGKGYAVAAKNVSELTEASYKRAFRIARTEGGRVQSTAKQKSYKEAAKKGVKLKKKWLSTLDGNARDTHQDLDGQTVEVNEQFTTSEGNSADGPRLFGVAEEDINCRCTTITEVNGISPELRRDNEDKETFPYRDFDEWYTAKTNANSKSIEYNYIDRKAYEKILSEGFKLTDRDKEKLYDFDTGYIQTINSFRINSILREGKFSDLDVDSKQTVKLLDKKMKEYALKDNVIARRYEGSAMLDNIFDQNQLAVSKLRSKELLDLLNSGSLKYQNKGYTSISMIPDDNVMKDRPIEVSIGLPVGQNVLVTDNVVKSEFILPRGMEFKIINFEIVKGKAKLVMEVVNNEK
ncbi:phage minor head protein [Virgibacillus sp. M23]|uniref:phage minor head protein n=1 Tax=Virgibacillus sp. M23 TaxID=3079030 RepID=UPI002A90C70B|nr:phage minor head protein [Virgibacillus sp. M23]MDY7044421.1 phage minor head protein [Virgibacillus sp. M23]